MEFLKYTVAVNAGGRKTKTSGEWTLKQGENRIVVSLPDGHIESARAELPLSVPDSERIFMNGFQTWTWCPERTKEDRLRGLQGLPRAAIRHYGLDRYGDYHFVRYPNRRGVSHGESWCYFRNGKTFRLIASLDEHNGYTLFRYDAGHGRLTVERDCGGLRCGGTFAAFELFFAEGTEDEVFDAWFAAMGIRPITEQKIAGYSSWYNRYEDITADFIRQDLKGCAGMLREGDLFQVDDGWEPAVGDWLEPDPVKFPDGMRPIADEIHAKGFKAGLWLAPFVAATKSKLYKEHPGWLLKHDGKPWRCGSNWGGFYSLDIDNPEVIDYVTKSFRRVFDEWGFDLVKLDFLYGAAPYAGSDAETRAGRMYRAVDFLRSVCGEKLILGCGVPVMPAFGKFEYCRISCDVGLDWNDTRIMQYAHRERVSTKQAIENSIFRRQLNGRAYLSDPDVFFLRDENLRLTEEEKRKLATVCGLTGGVFLTSDDMTKYTEEKKREYEEFRALREAEEFSVEADDGIAVNYRLNGEQHSLKIE